MNKASGADGITTELFQILKEDAIKVLHSICQKLWKTAVAARVEKVSFHPNSKERQCQKFQTTTIALISHASKIILKILQARLQHYVNWFPDTQAIFRKDKGTRDQTASICWIIEKTRELKKNLNLWLCESQQTVEIFKEVGIPDDLTSLLRSWYAGHEATVRTGHGTADWSQIWKEL